MTRLLAVLLVLPIGGLGEAGRLAVPVDISAPASYSYYLVTPEVIAREVQARDGRTVIQIRVELGVLQLEVTGRPDGSRPHGFTTYLEYLDMLRAVFAECARAYGERKGISYAAWREIGVSAPVLKRAGISPRSTAATRCGPTTWTGWPSR